MGIYYSLGNPPPYYIPDSTWSSEIQQKVLTSYWANKVKIYEDYGKDTNSARVKKQLAETQEKLENFSRISGPLTLEETTLLIRQLIERVVATT